MKKYDSFYSPLTGATTQLASFTPEAGGVSEFHAIIHVEPRLEEFGDQYNRILRAEQDLLNLPELADARIIFKRYFLSDACNQVSRMDDLYDRGISVSCIQQPPLDGSKVALWIYLQKGVSEVHTDDDGVVVVDHNGYRQLWKMGMMHPQGDSANQTTCLLEEFESHLAKYDATIEANCIRTWFYVRDVDIQYHGMVVARKANFEANGLTPQTHYISSTGIGGLPPDPAAIIQLGTFSLVGFDPKQQRYLYALDHLNKTIDYGVTFERGTLLEFGDRGHAYISGTASIDDKGNVLYLGDIRRQTERMWENVNALLSEGGMSMDDILQIVVYLRDTADYAVVSQMFAKRFPQTPYVITLAPVCRPAWLIEMECIAVDGRRTSFRPF